MGSALMKGAAAVVGPENIGFTDTDKPKVRAAAKALGALAYPDNAAAVQKADYVFLAVKPQVMPAVLDGIAPIVRERVMTTGKTGKELILVSMAAGWTIKKIQEAIGGAAVAPVIRIMPNTPALVSKGVITVASSPEVPPERSAELETILSACGMVEKLEEKYFDAVTGLSGSGPAFVYLFIESLADGGVQAGLARDKALRYAAQTVLGSAAMVLETGRHPGELKDMVCSPGGTTIAAVSSLEKCAFRGAVMGAVEAARKKASELGK
jgi:pyrroline-5-carboxylate reductase